MMTYDDHDDRHDDVMELWAQPIFAVCRHSKSPELILFVSGSFMLLSQGRDRRQEAANSQQETTFPKSRFQDPSQVI